MLLGAPIFINQYLLFTQLTTDIEESAFNKFLPEKGGNWLDKTMNLDHYINTKKKPFITAQLE